jgi:WD40 repeat protein
MFVSVVHVDGNVSLWDARMVGQLVCSFDHHNGPVFTSAFHPSGSYFVTGELASTQATHPAQEARPPSRHFALMQEFLQSRLPSLSHYYPLSAVTSCTHLLLRSRI